MPFVPALWRKFLLCLFWLMALTAPAAAADVPRLKTEILALAGSFAGQGDPDFSRQKQLDVLVDQLLAAAPQKPVRERIDLLAKPWKQVWGPYDYRHKGRGIDPEIGITEIYQVISRDGYYYNVAPVYKDGDRAHERIALLRGEYKLDETKPNRLRVHFTRYPGVDGRPAMPIWHLAARAENGTLENETTIVPTVIVWLFFGSGALDEVYTDDDMRITYGSDGSENGDRAIYVMTKAE